jgi:hypothetical protein
MKILREKAKGNKDQGFRPRFFKIFQKTELIPQFRLSSTLRNISFLERMNLSQRRLS